MKARDSFWRWRTTSLAGSSGNSPYSVHTDKAEAARTLFFRFHIKTAPPSATRVSSPSGHSYPGSTRLLPDSYPTTSVSSHPGNSRFGDCLTTAGCFATAVWYALAPCPKPRPYYPFPKRCASQVLLHSAFMRICVPASPLCPPWLRPSGPRQAIHSLSSP